MSARGPHRGSKRLTGQAGASRKALRAQGWDFLTDSRALLELRQNVLAQGARPDSCICCTKILTELGASFHLRVIPMVVEVSIMNRVFAEWAYRQTGNPAPAEVEAIAAQGGRLVVLGARGEHGRDPSKWPGHLVGIAVHHGRRVVVDLSIDQAHRPAKDIVFEEPLVFEVEREFMQGRTAVVKGQDGVVLFYRAFPEDTSYWASPDWQRTYTRPA